MNRQNVYDDPVFHVGYQQLRATGSGLNEEVEQPAIRSLLPPLEGLLVVDLGCGTAGQSVSLAEGCARYVVGAEPSKRMLSSAAGHDWVSYVLAFAEDVAFAAGSVDVVVASMSLHYVADLLAVLRSVASWVGRSWRRWSIRS